ncbi:MAG: HU family DNA-binding protein [Proteobacteria bacterium]|nr:HU family DNA-binding protein [Pseudomonadota bacterium]
MSKVVTKTDLIEQVSQELGVTKVLAGKAVNSIVDSIKDTLANGDDVQLIGFGSFTTADYAERNGVHPRTREKIRIPAKIVPKFRPGKTLREAINGKEGNKKRGILGIFRRK